MEVILESPDAPHTALHAQAMRRIRQAMRSLSWLVASARVRLSGADDAQSGIDRRCEVELVTEEGQTVVVTSLARDWNSALHSALSRASKSLLHRWQQERGALVPRRLGSRAAAC